MSFVHLQVHSEYSLIDGIIRLKPLFSQLQSQQSPAVAITDHHNLFALVKAYRAAQAAGVKLIVGADLYLFEDEQYHRFILLCENHDGYLNLNRLISRSYQQGQHLGRPLLRREWFNNATAGLIAISPGAYGDIGQSLLKQDEHTHKYLRFWQQHFPDRFYLGLHRTGRQNEETALHALVEFAIKQQLPVVALNEACFLDTHDFDAHEIRVCINQGYTLNDKRRPHAYSPEQYLRSPEEMQALFSDIPEAIENTLLIAQRCNVNLTLGKNFLPAFPIPDGMTAAEYFSEQSRKGLEKRLTFLFGDKAAEKRKPYDERLQIELDVILQMDFPGYFLIVAEFIQWAKDHDIPVGPGRGSGAGSLVAYALDITDLDPLEYDLLFERFLNPERVSMPDFDVDFCMDKRDLVIQHVAELYGREKVSQIITYGSMAAKAVIRDVGRVLGHGYGFVDQIAKLIPFEVGISLSKAMEQETALQTRYDEDDEARALIDMAKKLEGISRNAGKHAGGVVIAPTALTDFAPLYCEEDGSSVVTQYDKNDVEAVGLVKFDFLGLRTLTIIDWALNNIKKADPSQERINILAIPLDDRATFKSLKAAETTAVFQLESRGMKELIKRLLPDNFEDIIALVALFRPGPLQSGMVDDFINRKHGRAKIEYLHADLANNKQLQTVLDPTYGVIVYQEQVMQIAQVLSGYSLGGADILRRAMGKKDPAVMAKQRDVFVDGAVKNNINEKTADYVFNFVESFAGYGFNKSHSAAYALVSYQTAWLKTHYPAAFMAAVMSADMDNTDKIVMLIDECKRMQLKILPPHINHSAYQFTLTEDSNSIYYGLGAIKGAGEGALENIIEERQENGAYSDLFDFCQRINLRKCNRRVLEGLIKAGGLDDLHSDAPDRHGLLESLPSALKMADQQTSSRDQNDLFGMPALDETQTEETLPYAECPPWKDKQRLQAEKDTLGLYLSGHPIQAHLKELAHYCKPLKQISPTGRGQNCKVGGLILEIRQINSRRGRMASITLDDSTARLDIMLFSSIYEENQGLLKKDQILIAEGEVKEDSYNGGFSMSASSVYSLAQARGRFAEQLKIKLDGDQHSPEFIEQLQQQLKAYQSPEGCPVSFDYHWQGNQAQLQAGKEWRVLPDEALLEELEMNLGLEYQLKFRDKSP